ncbi:MAG TPA: hypothetical protein VKP00_11275 [Gemmatimonadaceae bacterium]|nr:hypothetical protein [Gemmatimonadaceae bacterium]
MSMKRALQWIFAISLVGVAFSGTLTWQEMFAKTIAACPSPGAPGTVFGYPACVYGLVMYIVIASISGAGLWGGRRSSVGAELS